MPRYFFALTENARSTGDTEGTELPNLEAARSEAIDTLVQVAKDRGRPTSLSMRVLDAENMALLTVTLLLKVESPAG